MPSRRHLLAAVGLAVTGSGCMGVLGDEGDEDDSEADPEGVLLGELYVQNDHEENHQIQLAVEDDGDVVHLGTYEFDEEVSSRNVEGPWTNEPGDYRIHARLDDRDVQSLDVTDGVDDAECVRVLARIDGEGRLSIWNRGGCEQRGF